MEIDRMKKTRTHACATPLAPCTSMCRRLPSAFCTRKKKKKIVKKKTKKEEKTTKQQKAKKEQKEKRFKQRK